MKQSLLKAIHRAALSLRGMTNEMFRKEIELGRISKTASLLILSGLSPVSISNDILNATLGQQKSDGGWIGVPDTMWAIKYLSLTHKFGDQIQRGLNWIEGQKVGSGWGRSARDMGRIPVTGALLCVLPELANKEKLKWLEDLWVKERNSITYKAAYTLMAFKKNDYKPKTPGLIEETMSWLKGQQNDDGGFGPWIGHPVGSNILCTALALIGLLQYEQFCDKEVFTRGLSYILANQLPNGLWPYHQIEDGSSWGLYAMTLIFPRLEHLNRG